MQSKRVTFEIVLDILDKILKKLIGATLRNKSPLAEKGKTNLKQLIAKECEELTKVLYQTSLYSFDNDTVIEPDYPLTFFKEVERLLQKISKIAEGTSSIDNDLPTKFKLNSTNLNILKLIIATKSLSKTPSKQWFYDEDKFHQYLDQVAKFKQELSKNFQDVHQFISSLPNKEWQEFCTKLSVTIFDIVDMYAFWGTKLPSKQLIKQFYSDADNRTQEARSELYNLYFKAQKAWSQISASLDTNTTQSNLENAKKLRQSQAWINELYVKINQSINLDRYNLYLDENNKFLEIIEKISDQINEQAQNIQLLSEALQVVGKTTVSSNSSNLTQMPNKHPNHSPETKNKINKEPVLKNIEVEKNTLKDQDKIMSNQEYNIAVLINDIYQCNKRIRACIEQILHGKLVDESHIQILIKQQHDLQEAMTAFPLLMESEEIADQIEKLTNNSQICALCYIMRPFVNTTNSLFKETN